MGIASIRTITMTADQLTNILNFFQLGMFVKLFVLILGLFYFVFTAVVYGQIDLMNQILKSQIAPLVKTIALVQIFLAGVLFFLIILFV